jgi:hypothetical protein
LNKNVLDINNLQEELKFIRNEISLLNDRLLAVSSDYRNFLQKDFKQDKVYTLSQNINFRIFSTHFHFKLLNDHYMIIKKQIENGTRNY